MIQYIIKLFRTKEQIKVLGRWGYHWDKNIIYNKYYD